MSHEVLRLWDGHEYDAAHLATTYAGLAEYAREHECLQDTVELSDLETRRWRRPVQFRTALLAILLFLLVVAGVCLASDILLAETILVLVGAAVPSAALLILFAATRFRGEDLPRTIIVRDGFVTITTPKGTQRFQLADCCWFPGRLHDDPLLVRSLAKGRAVILVPRSGDQFACGLDEHHGARWRAFLEVAGVRRVLYSEGLVGCLMILGGFAAAILAGIAGWHIADLAVPALRRFIFPAMVDKLPGVAATVSAWGAYLAVHIAVPGWYRGTDKAKAGLFKVSLFIPLVVLGMGRRGLGLVKWDFVERMAIILLLSATQCLLTWLVLRSIDKCRRNGKQGRIPAPEPPPNTSIQGD